MNILAIDFGTKHIGLAWMQEGLDVVLPFGRIMNQESGIRNQELLRMIKEEKIDKIIIGLPIGTDGKENTNTKRVREFAKELEQATGLAIEFVDERFSSQLADRMQGDASRDEKAAMAILETYMKSSKLRIQNSKS